MRIAAATISAFVALSVAALATAARRPAPGVTLSATSPLVVLGRTTTLSGTGSTRQVNERVTLLAQPCGSSSFQPLSTTLTGTAGTWAVATPPLLNTSYQARFRGATSATVTVGVRPRVTLSKLRARRYRVRVRAAQSFAGKVAVFQRYRASVRRWVRVRAVRLGDAGTGIGPTVISGADFASRLPARVRVRVVLPQRQVGACYLPGRSNVIRA